MNFHCEIEDVVNAEDHFLDSKGSKQLTIYASAFSRMYRYFSHFGYINAEERSLVGTKTL